MRLALIRTEIAFASKRWNVIVSVSVSVSVIVSVSVRYAVASCNYSCNVITLYLRVITAPLFGLRVFRILGPRPGNKS